MAKPTGFLEFKREDVEYRPISERTKDFFEINLPHPEEVLIQQAARCMDCGIPFCHGTGCPLGNRIPEFNDMIYRGHWREASDNLHATNNFPEVTGRVCPAPCEASCTLGINDSPVLIKHIEYQIVERAFAMGWIQPQPPEKKTGKKVAIIGSGPAGLAAAQQLIRMSHDVTVFEKDECVGGLLRYGIPDFKLDKQIIERRVKQLIAEGIQFQTGVCVGEDVSVRYLKKNFDAICLTMGAGQPRDLTVDGRQLKNVHFAMEFLAQQNCLVSGELTDKDRRIPPVKDRIVAVIGGGDTGSDCVGTSIRQGAKQVHQYEIMPEPPVDRPDTTPWPQWPLIKRTSSSHEEGCQRYWSTLTKKLVGRDGKVTELVGCKVNWVNDGNRMKMEEVPGSEFTQRVDMVLLAMGFVHVVHNGLIDAMQLNLDPRGNVVTENYMTSQPGIFAAGDTARGASLVVHAINTGREAAAAVDTWLMHK